MGILGSEMIVTESVGSIHICANFIIIIITTIYAALDKQTVNQLKDHYCLHSSPPLYPVLN